MIRKLLFLFLLAQITGFSQEKETVVIQKSNYKIYRGVLAETKSWYLLTDAEGDFYLANLDRPNETVYEWFVRFKDSQNIYKASLFQSEGMQGIGMNSYKTLHFSKPNDTADILNFYLDKTSNSTIILTSLTDGIVYCFELQIQ
jgi:hypothetical protein